MIVGNYGNDYVPPPTPCPGPAFFTLPNISGPSIAKALPRMAARRWCKGRRRCHRRLQCSSVEACIVEQCENMWDAAAEQRRAHLPREIGHYRGSQFSRAQSSVVRQRVGDFTQSVVPVYTHIRRHNREINKQIFKISFPAVIVYCCTPQQLERRRAVPLIRIMPSAHC